MNQVLILITLFMMLCLFIGLPIYCYTQHICCEEDNSEKGKLIDL
jgi:hypothetical protein